MKFNANLSLLYSELPFLERFSAAAEDGFRAVEIQFPYDTPAAEIKSALEQAGLEFVLINVPAGDLMSGGLGLACVPGREPEFEQALEQCIEYVRILRPTSVNVLAGRAAAEDRAESLNVLHSNINKAVSMLEPEGVQVTLEAINTYDMPEFLISSFAEMRDFIEESQVNVRMQFDIYHMTRMGEPVAALLRQYGSQIGHIQFADVPGRHEPGSGELDIKSLCTIAAESGYQGWFAAEYRPAGQSTREGLGWTSDFF